MNNISNPEKFQKFSEKERNLNKGKLGDK